MEVMPTNTLVVQGLLTFECLGRYSGIRLINPPRDSRFWI